MAQQVQKTSDEIELRFLEKQKGSQCALSGRITGKRMRLEAAGKPGTLCRSWLEFRYHFKCDEKLTKGFEQMSNMI